MTVHAVGALPAGALDAAALFHARDVPAIRALLAGETAGGHVVVVFGPAGHDQRGWRLAAVQALARAAAPVRVNAVQGDDPAALAATLAWLDDAPGITGQLFALADADVTAPG